MPRTAPTGNRCLSIRPRPVSGIRSRLITSPLRTNVYTGSRPRTSQASTVAEQITQLFHNYDDLSIHVAVLTEGLKAVEENLSSLSRSEFTIPAVTLLGMYLMKKLNL